METRINTARNTILIIGNGPTGLAAALEAIRNSDSEIVIVGNRKSFTRSQIIGLERSTVHYLAGLLGSQKIDDLIKSNILYFNQKTQYYNVAIKQLETVLFESLPETKRIRFLYTDPSKKIEDTIQIDQRTGKVIVDTEIGNDVFYCRYVIGADGAKHSSADLFNVPYDELSNKPKNAQVKPYPYHYTAIFNVPYNHFANTQQDQASKRLYTYLDINRFSRDYKIIHYNSFMVAGELPTYIHNEKDENKKKELLEKWIGPYVDTANNRLAPEITFFKSKLEQAKVCKVAFSDLNDPSYYFPLGDAFSHSFYTTSKGCNNGLCGTRAFGEFLKDQDIVKYSDKMQDIATANEAALTVNSRKLEQETFEKIWPKQLALMEVCELILNDIEKYLAVVARRKCFSFFYNKKISEKRENMAIFLKKQTQAIFSKLDENMELINQPGCYTDADQNYAELENRISAYLKKNNKMKTKNSKLNDLVLVKAKKYLDIYSKASNDKKFTVEKSEIKAKLKRF